MSRFKVVSCGQHRAAVVILFVAGLASTGCGSREPQLPVMSMEGGNAEIYPMPAFPTLEVRDTAAVSEWYQNVLGFQHIFSLPGPDGQPLLVHLRWAKYADLLLRQESVPLQEPKGVGVSFTFALSTAGGLDALAERARGYGARILSEPKNQPWNVRDFAVADPEGFRLIFTYGPVNPDLRIDQVIDRSRGTNP